MRRALPFLLMVTFLLGPLAAAFQAGDESRLPACCRRHGEHHCTMGAGAAEELQAADSGAAFAAPAHCPFFPRTIAQLPQAPVAQTGPAAISTAAREQAYAPAQIRTAILPAAASPHSGRAPPALRASATIL